MDFTDDLAKVAFEAVLQAQSAGSAAELNTAVGAALRRIGYSHFVAVEFFGPAEDRQIRIIDGEDDLAWQAHYISQRFARLDPGVAIAARTTEPFFRSDLQARGQVSPAQVRVIEESRLFGIEDSFFAPQHQVDGSVGAVVLTAKEPVDKSARGRMAAYLLANGYGQLVRRFALTVGTAASGADGTVLSRRQLECLKWVREGIPAQSRRSTPTRPSSRSNSSPCSCASRMAAGTFPAMTSASSSTCSSTSWSR